MEKRLTNILLCFTRAQSPLVTVKASSRIHGLDAPKKQERNRRNQFWLVQTMKQKHIVEWRPRDVNNLAKMLLIRFRRGCRIITSHSLQFIRPHLKARLHLIQFQRKNVLLVVARQSEESFFFEIKTCFCFKEWLDFGGNSFFASLEWQDFGSWSWREVPYSNLFK
jgi:hypothetical protein